ncbi:MAG TPA: hypothetical protein VF784_14610 [Anaerolineales bacterium]
MADTLTQLIATVQANLLDNATLFSTATITAAARLALADINTAVPAHAAATFTAVDKQKEYELSAYDAQASGITDVLLRGENEYDVSLLYDAYVEDDRWFFRLRTPQPAGKTLVALYTTPYTISGLDGSLDSSLPDPLNIAAIDGSCYYACLARAALAVEANNIETAVSSNWMKLARAWGDRFNKALRDCRTQPTTKGEPSTAAWNDPQHDPEYP